MKRNHVVGYARPGTCVGVGKLIDWFGRIIRVTVTVRWLAKWSAFLGKDLLRKVLPFN